MRTNGILKRRMPNTYVKYMAQAFDDHVALTAGTSLATVDLADYDESIVVADVLTCLDNAIDLADTDDWYLDWARGMAEHYHGPVTMAAVNAPTLGHGLDAFVRYMPTRVPYHHWNGRETDQCFYCELTELLDFGRGRPMVIEIPLLILREYVGRMQRRTAAGARVDLRYPPTPHAATYANWFQCDVRFDAPQNALVIPAEWRAIKNVGFDEGNWALAIRRCEEMSDTAAARPTDERVRDVVLQHLDSGEHAAPPTLARVAERLHVSARSLIRHLAKAGTKYQDIVDDVQKERAHSLLTGTSMPVYEVGNRLGFKDPASFGRSFKRWFGIPPGDYRARRKHIPPR